MAETNGRKYSFPQNLVLLFTYLKLTGNIDWSWWGVCSPLLFCIIIGLLALIAGASKEARESYNSGKVEKEKKKVDFSVFPANDTLN